MKEDPKKSLTGDDKGKAHETASGHAAHEAVKGHPAPVKAPGPMANPAAVPPAQAPTPAPGQAPEPSLVTQPAQTPVPQPDSQQRAAELEMAKKEGGGQIQPEAPGAADKQQSRRIVADASVEAARMGRTGAGARNLKEVLPGEPGDDEASLPKPTARDLEIEARHDDGNTAPRLFRVQIRDCAALNVRATSKGAAWLKYKRHCGIVKTENEPTFADPGPDAEADIP